MGDEIVENPAGHQKSMIGACTADWEMMLPFWSLP
jgi:hypothetical protein